MLNHYTALPSLAAVNSYAEDSISDPVLKAVPLPLSSVLFTAAKSQQEGQWLTIIFALPDLHVKAWRIYPWPP